MNKHDNLCLSTHKKSEPPDNPFQQLVMNIAAIENLDNATATEIQKWISDLKPRINEPWTSKTTY